MDDVSACTHAHSERLMIDNGDDEPRFLAESVRHHRKPREVSRDIQYHRLSFKMRLIKTELIPA